MVKEMKNTITVAGIAALCCVVCGCGPDDGSKELAEGRQAYELKDFTKARELFAESLVLAPENVDTLLLLARVNIDLGEIAAATNAAAEAAALAPDDADVKLVEAQALWHAKDYKRSAELFKSVANDTKLTPQLRAQGWAGLGVVEIASESDPHLARIAFLRAIRIDRMNASAWYHLGLVYRDEFGYYEAALEHFEIFVRLEAAADPRVQRVQRSLIPALKETIARNTSSRAGVAKRDSAASAAALARAESLWKKSHFKNAREAYAQAAKADPLSYPAALGLAKAWLKTDKTPEGRKKALNCYRDACSLRPGAISTFVTAGELAAGMKYHAQAAEIFSRAIAASPASIQCIDGLIRALNGQGGHKSAARAYQLYRESIPIRRK